MLILMTPGDLEKYLHDHIPLSRAMQVRVVDASPETVTLGAPLPPNINHRETVFGGSSSALAILSAWSLLYTRLKAEGLTPRLVIRRNTMTYDAPIGGSFFATATSPDDATWSRFLRILERKGRARVAVSSVLRSETGLAGRMDGEFVAIGAK